ncbi:hypothetical protein [Salinibacter altiplanensis]|uniref:hypothetical protein n=1 Tax=Salinibacter altiplanensis TaxID=1803181 RepID=UPI000C9F27FE|nr:hypothetical protein [Salinibacter altiplanensis]
MDFFAHHIEVTRPPDRDGLGRESGTATTVYDGPAEIQEQAVKKRGQSGQVVRVGDATGFIPDDEPFDLQASDVATVTRPDGTTFAATVASVTRLDQSFVLSKDR